MRGNGGQVRDTPQLAAGHFILSAQTTTFGKCVVSPVILGATGKAKLPPAIATHSIQLRCEHTGNGGQVPVRGMEMRMNARASHALPVPPSMAVTGFLNGIVL